MNPGLLRRIDAYLDAVPRAACRTESIGPLTLFVNDAPGWRYYARPTPGAGPVTAADVALVRRREREVGMPETIEWVRDLVPSAGPAARAAGLEVEDVPADAPARGSVLGRRDGGSRTFGS